MSDLRRFVRRSGRLVSSPIADGWAISRTNRDPSIPNLPLETLATTDRTGFGPFSRLGLAGVSQQLYGSFAGKVGDSFAVDVTDTWAVSSTETTESLTLSALTDTWSVSLADTAELLAAAEVTDTWTVSVTDSAEVAEVEATQPAQPEQPSGGYGALNEYDASRQRNRRRKRLEDDEDDPPPTVAQDATPPDTSRDMELTRQLVAYWSGEADREMLNRRAQRALDYALRAESVLAMQLFERELMRQMEEEEMALLLTLLND